MKNKNQKLLKDFANYCKKHPEERFWQALSNWIKYDIYIKDKQFGYYFDTFYFEGKNK